MKGLVVILAMIVAAGFMVGISLGRENVLLYGKKDVSHINYKDDGIRIGISELGEND